MQVFYMKNSFLFSTCELPMPLYTSTRRTIFAQFRFGRQRAPLDGFQLRSSPFSWVGASKIIIAMLSVIVKTTRRILINCKIP